MSASKKVNQGGASRSGQKKVLPASCRKGSSVSSSATSFSKKPLNEVWWCAVHPHGYANWRYLDLTKKNVAELLTTHEGQYWEARGWRIAKLQVTELTD